MEESDNTIKMRVIDLMKICPNTKAGALKLIKVKCSDIPDGQSPESLPMNERPAKCLRKDNCQKCIIERLYSKVSIEQKAEV